MQKTIKAVTALFTVFCSFLFALTFILQNDLPDNYYSDKKVLKINYFCKISSHETYSDSTLMATKNKNSSDSSIVTLKLMGVFPIKNVAVKKTERQYVTPSGEPFGIKLYTQGVMVVGLSEINSGDKSVCPAKDVGIKEGDIILEINGEKVTSNEDMAAKVDNSNGKKIEILIKREEARLLKNLTPVFSENSNRYLTGIWVRDSSAGIGTLTYYTNHGFFGGLGHPVCDIDTGGVLPISSGEIVSAKISGVTKSVASCAGELKGYFCSGNIKGNIITNCNEGLFGVIDISKLESNPLPVAFCQEVKLGDAEILTTVDEDEPKYYDCIIEKINYNEKDEAKNLTIKITDPKLLAITGGIVQGMSGSPIIQDGKLIGAVTHVFVNNPDKGYAVFAEKMYECSQNIENDLKDAAA